MSEVIARVLDLASVHGGWAAPMIGLMAFAESLLIIGMFIPAAAVIVAIGALIGTGSVEPLAAYLCAFLGAILGDWLSYAIGRYVGPGSYRRWPLNRHKPAVARARLFFQRYGVAAIVLGRFFGPVRATIPVVAGALRMDKWSFQIANIVSAAIWVAALFAPAYLTARHFPMEAITSAHIAMLGVVVVAITLLCSMASVRFFTRAASSRRS